MQHPELKRRGDLTLAYSSSWVDDTEIVKKLSTSTTLPIGRIDQKSENVIDKIISVVSEITEGYSMSFAGVGEDEGDSSRRLLHLTAPFHWMY